LFIAGFSFVTTERDLEKKFSRFGRVNDVRIVRDKLTGDSRGFGFLSLERDEDADAAIRALDQTQWNGRIVLVEKSKTSAR
jgi:transformer-2 protein